MRRILLLGGTPRLQVDAVRYLSAVASGATAVALHDALVGAGQTADLLLSDGAEPSVAAQRYSDRNGLEAGLKGWITAHPDGVVVMSAAINDYRVDRVEMVQNGETVPVRVGGKIPSRLEEVVIHLRPAAKVIDQLHGWGLRGPVVGFKYEGRETVLAAAEALLRRAGAALVVANSICGTVQALVDARGVQPFPDRAALVAALALRLAALAAA
jgi:phosphopantothenoylcysteine synthetase/decarboxylase